MEKYEVGMLARSKAGHETYVYLIDGSGRKLENPKKKKKKHVQLICEKYELSGVDDVAIKRILKLFDKETGRN